MRNLILCLVFFGVAIFFGFKLYNKDAPKLDGNSEPAGQSSFAYPDQLELESVDGRMIEVTLLGRSERHIQFDRVSDGKRFVYPIDQLTPDSQTRVRQYPDVGVADAGAFVADGQLELEDAYVEQLRVAISRIDTKVQDLELQASRSQSKTEQRTIQREVEDLQKEKEAFRSKIAERQ